MKSIFVIILGVLTIYLNCSIISIPVDYTTIQEGLTNAEVGDTVLVAEGIYYENLYWPETNGVKLIGISKENCIIDGDQQDSVINYEHWNVIHDSTNVIKNFTIQNGLSYRGAGIYLRSDNQFILENLLIQNNKIYEYLKNSSNDNRYSLEGGAGIQLDNNSSPMIRNVEIINNYSEFHGGGIQSYYGSDPTLINVLIAGNYTTKKGGGICVEASSVINMINVTIANNVAEEDGGGIYHNSYNESYNIYNTIIWGNLPEEISINCGEVYDCTYNIVYSDIQGGIADIETNGNIIINWDDSNISINPEFENPTNDDYHLSNNSPCIDAGDPTSPLDPDGTVADMGRYYFDQLSEVEEDGIYLNELSLECYPNPFNPSRAGRSPTTTINFDLDNGEELTNLSIYNIKGQLVKTFVNNKLTSGNHQITWNGLDNHNQKVSSGVYFYKLDNGKNSLSKKMMLIK